MIDYAFTDLAHEALQAGARVTNPASRRVLEKCGFQWTGVGLYRIRAINSSAPIDRFRLERGIWSAIKTWGRVEEGDVRLAGRRMRRSMTRHGRALPSEDADLGHPPYHRDESRRHTRRIAIAVPRRLRGHDGTAHSAPSHGSRSRRRLCRRLELRAELLQLGATEIADRHQIQALVGPAQHIESLHDLELWARQGRAQPCATNRLMTCTRRR